MDRRERSWRKLRVVVEVTVPPTNRATEKDLMQQMQDWGPDTLSFPRSAVHGAYIANVRYKTFGRFVPAYLLEKKRRKTR